MRKEVILAITIGFGLGLIITYGVWLANKSLKTLPVPGDLSPTPSVLAASDTPLTSTPSTSGPTPTPAASGALQISITEPADELIAEKDQITVSGATTANAIVAIIYEGGQVTTTADASGKFTASIPLEGGYNRITATAYDTKGNTATTQITATYTTSKI